MNGRATASRKKIPGLMLLPQDGIFWTWSRYAAVVIPMFSPHLYSCLVQKCGIRSHGPWTPWPWWPWWPGFKSWGFRIIWPSFYGQDKFQETVFPTEIVANSWWPSRCSVKVESRSIHAWWWTQQAIWNKLEEDNFLQAFSDFTGVKPLYNYSSAFPPKF